MSCFYHGIAQNNTALLLMIAENKFCCMKIYKSIFIQEGVVLGADTRATGGSIVCDLNCEKIHYIADNVYCCGAGTAADTEFTTRSVPNSRPPVELAVTLLHPLQVFSLFSCHSVPLQSIDLALLLFSF